MKQKNTQTVDEREINRKGRRKINKQKELKKERKKEMRHATSR